MRAVRRRSSRQVRSRRGATLVELVVTMTILTVGLFALAGTATLATRMSGEGARQTAAATVAQRRIEQL